MRNTARCNACIHYKMCAWCVDAEHCAFFTNKADVVPRADAERWKTLSDRRVKIARDALAAEIFEEIEKAITKFGTMPYNDGIISLDAIAAIKKKYTEGPKE